jgi:hypothetical protein
MIKITCIETVYPAPEGDEDYCPDGEAFSREEGVSFRELVSLMREHMHPSSSQLEGTESEWFTAESYQDPYTGEYILNSLHYAHDNPPRMVKYWKAAMRIAGYRVV